ncbi:MAG: hypothetical protein ABL876_00065 [Chitinophagaceae bacterium]
MSKSIDIEPLREFVSETLISGADVFTVLSFACKDEDHANEIATRLGATEGLGDVRVSKGGVRAVDLTCENSAMVVLTWQGSRPAGKDAEAATEVAGEYETESEEQ